MLYNSIDFENKFYYWDSFEINILYRFEMTLRLKYNNYILVIMVNYKK